MSYLTKFIFVILFLFASAVAQVAAADTTEYPHKKKIIEFALNSAKFKFSNLSLSDAPLWRRVAAWAIENDWIEPFELKDFPILWGRNISFVLEGDTVNCFAGAWMKKDDEGNWYEAVITVEACTPTIGKVLVDRPDVLLNHPHIRLYPDGTPSKVLPKP